MALTVLTVVVGLMLMGSGCQATVCEDADPDCARLDLERNICGNPFDSIMHCAKYCGHCPAPGLAIVSLCEDSDPSCPTYANPRSCALELTRRSCPKSCDVCGATDPSTNMGWSGFQGTKLSAYRAGVAFKGPNYQRTGLEWLSRDQIISVQGQQGTTSPSTDTPQTPAPFVEARFEVMNSRQAGTHTALLEVPDPRCQDVDHHCNSFIHLNDCINDPLTRLLCQRSCDLCPYVLASQLELDNSSSVNNGPTSSDPSSTNEKYVSAGYCEDHDGQCPVLLQTFSCDKDPLLAKLCPLSCAKCNVSSNTTRSNETQGRCLDYDEECTVLAPYCNRTDMLVHRLCQMSCGACDGPAALTAASDSGTTTTVPSVQDECYDLDPNCTTITQGGACNHNELVSRVCPVTCKVCNETRTKPSQDGQCIDHDPECYTLHYACGAVDLVDKLCPLTCAVCKNTQTCHICTDPFCDGAEPTQRCPPDEPYCLNAVVNEVNGNRHISKTCGSERDCVLLWSDQSSNDTRCRFYDVDHVYNEAFSCYYCCEGNNCNGQVVPLEHTHFRIH